MIGSVVVASGPSRWSRPAHAGDDDGRAALRVAQAPQQLEALAHRLDGRADPLERQRLPGREHGDLVGGQELGQVVAELGRHRRRRRGHHERPAVRQRGQGGDGDRAGHLDHGQPGVGLAEGAGQRRFVAQQRGEISQSHGGTTLPSPLPPTPSSSCISDVPATDPDVTRECGVRIVSLLPSATEILFQLGLGDDVVGVTFECDTPVEARSQADRVDLGAARGPHAGRDRRRRQGADRRRRGPLPARRGRLRRPRPDARDHPGPVRGVRHRRHRGRRRPRPPRVPGRRADARPVDAGRRASGPCWRSARPPARRPRRRRSSSGAGTGWPAIAAAVAGAPRRPTLVLEWTDPAFTAGHWVPDLVDGGRRDAGARTARAPTRSASSGRRSPACGAEVVIVAPCGFDLDGAAGLARRGPGRRRATGWRRGVGRRRRRRRRPSRAAARRRRRHVRRHPPPRPLRAARPPARPSAGLTPAPAAGGTADAGSIVLTVVIAPVAHLAHRLAERLAERRQAGRPEDQQHHQQHDDQLARSDVHGRACVRRRRTAPGERPGAGRGQARGNVGSRRAGWRASRRRARARSTARRRLDRLARRAPRGHPAPRAVALVPAVEAGAAQRARPAPPAVDPVVGHLQLAAGRVLRPPRRVGADDGGAEPEQAGQPLDRSRRLVRRHADDERQLDGVDVAEPGHVALVEQGAGQRRLGLLGDPLQRRRRGRAAPVRTGRDRGGRRSGPRRPSRRRRAPARRRRSAARSPSTARPAAATPTPWPPGRR